ncbi:hypothetical protein B0T25DRAFT_217826 [Lasiosphaeria hispida]|uniref:Uncharacterized protein n=1 Tax=Lasiosphaeria hispida TaxID=260671 RepID=A0AAJ0HJ03_9PEZI|nr:hypothetical protein B0T25DRAFT_217826 [Lasiosphaeria hispida]
MSEFFIDDIFSSSYPGQRLSPPYHSIKGNEELRWQTQTTPDVIVRHHRAPWKTPRLAQRWLASAAYLLRTQLPEYLEWQLDPDMFTTFGWVGYTCRHRYRPRHTSATARAGLGDVDKDDDLETDGPLQLDHPNTIRTADQKAQKEGAKGRPITVLVMIEYAKRLSELRQLDQVGDEEYLLTAFMCAVTVLHELGHVIYWRDFRATNRRMTEPYFGGDLEMELGDSFVASIFGGWIPVPVDVEREFRCRRTFQDGLAWRQHLTWDFHRTRPKYRAHYSISVK